MPILVFLRPFVFELGVSIYGTERRTDKETDRRTGITRNAAY